MNTNSQIKITIPKDKEGMIGRDCPDCKRYFKIKPGTGLPTKICNCPYCDFKGESNCFNTPAQISYAKSKATNQIMNDFSKEIKGMFKDVGKKFDNSLVQIKMELKSSGFSVPIKYYSEKDLETKVICDKCGLNFSIYGVFAKCPDCTKMNAFNMFEKSLEAIRKQYNISLKPDIPTEVVESLLASILSNCVSAFDSLGKEIKKRNLEVFPERPKNLFQNIIKLNEVLNGFI